MARSTCCAASRRVTLLPSAHAVDREFRVISALHGSAVPVAQPLCLCTDESVIGTMFYLMEYAAGRNFWDPTLPGMTRRSARRSTTR